MRIVHPCTTGGAGASGPPAGVCGQRPQWGFGGNAPEAKKWVVFWPMVFDPLYYSSSFGTSSFRGWKTLYICIMAVYFASSCIVKDPCIRRD